MNLNGVVVVVALALLACVPRRSYSQLQRLEVPMTLVRNASALGACKKVSFTFCVLKYSQ